MPRKDEFLSQLLSSKTQEIVSSPRNYTAFLQTAAQNYKYRFQEQVLIHAQRPDATACAEIGVWNRLGRWVNRGATGIALLRSPNLPYRIRYVFDISDTNNRENREISLWQMKPEYENEVIHTLQGKFLLDSNHYWGEVVEVSATWFSTAAVMCRSWTMMFLGASRILTPKSPPPCWVRLSAPHPNPSSEKLVSP